MSKKGLARSSTRFALCVLCEVVEAALGGHLDDAAVVEFDARVDEVDAAPASEP